MANKWMSKICADFGTVAESLPSNLLPVIPTRSPSLNWATANGGFQPGKISVLYGIESSGKSLLAMMAVADYQKETKKLSLSGLTQSLVLICPYLLKLAETHLD